MCITAGSHTNKELYIIRLEVIPIHFVNKIGNKNPLFILIAVGFN